MAAKATESRLLVRLAGGIAGMLVLVLPLGYFALSYQRMAGSLEAEADINARILSQIIGANPEMWRFEEIRIQEYLSRRPAKGSVEMRRILDMDGAPLLSNGNAPRPPAMVRRMDLFDAGRVVARVEISRSLRALLIKTVLVFLLTLILGAATLWAILLLPVRIAIQSEKALRESEQRYRMLFEQAGDCVLVLELPADGPPVIQEANPAALKMLGYARDELIGKPISLLDMDPALPRESEGGLFEARHRRKDGSIFTAEAAMRVALSGSTRYAILIERDTSERKRTEAALASAQKLESLGTLAGGIAHDFNNILTAIRGNLSILQLSISGGEALEVLNEAQDACGTAAGLARQLLTFSKGGTPVVQTLDLRPLLTQAAGFATRGSNVRCVFDLGEASLPAAVDKGQLAQVVSNLVINARQAMPNGGAIMVRARVVALAQGECSPLKAGRYVQMTFEDQGGGIPAEHLSRIFEPFFSTKAKGRGLGLPIVYSTMAKHGGHVAVESRPGKGTIFTLHLPAANETDILPEKEISKLVCGHAKILVMDDEAPVAQVLKRMLEKLGYQAEAVPDGAAALAAYGQAREAGRPYDAVIMDLTIAGGMGGKEAIGKLKLLDPDAKAIVSSGYSDDPVMADWKSSGFSGALAKPFQMTEISETLRKVLGADAG